MKHRAPEFPISFNVFTPARLADALNGEALDPAVYRRAVERPKGRRLMNVGGLMRELRRPSALQKLLKPEFEYPVALVRTARLRQLVDEWIATGFTADGDCPWSRELSRAYEAIAAVRSCVATNPCSLHFDEKSGEVLVGVGAPPHRLIPELPFSSAIAEADMMFTCMIASAEWKYQISRCGYLRCGQYFVHPRPRDCYRHGMFCSREHQRRASADALTKARRSNMQYDLIQNAATLLVSWQKGAGWQDDRRLKTRLAARVSGRLSKIPALRAGRDEVKANWVTRHRAEIERRRSELVTLR